MTTFQTYDSQLETVMPLKYLGHLFKATEYDCTTVIINLQKAQKIWARKLRILGREGADTRMSGRFFLAMMQTTLLFGTETWVTNPLIVRLLGVFHHRVAQRILGKQPRRQKYWALEYPTLWEDMRAVGLEEMET